MATLLIVFNSWQDTVMFRLPSASNGNGWILEMDTNLPSAPVEGQRIEVGQEYGVTGRSLVLFQLG
jgi:glycogen operon protein